MFFHIHRNIPCQQSFLSFFFGFGRGTAACRRSFLDNVCCCFFEFVIPRICMVLESRHDWGRGEKIKEKMKEIQSGKIPLFMDKIQISLLLFYCWFYFFLLFFFFGFCVSESSGGKSSFPSLVSFVDSNQKVFRKSSLRDDIFPHTNTKSSSTPYIRLKLQKFERSKTS